MKRPLGRFMRASERDMPLAGRSSSANISLRFGTVVSLPRCTRRRRIHTMHTFPAANKSSTQNRRDLSRGHLAAAHTVSCIEELEKFIMQVIHLTYVRIRT